MRHGLLTALAVVCALMSGCFSPDLGQGRVRCGDKGICPPGYACSAGVCYGSGSDLAVADLATLGGPDMPGPGPGPDMARCKPTVKCGTFCGTKADDGCGNPLRCECDLPNTCSSKVANSCECTRITACSQLPGDIHCGKYPDGCGSTIQCDCTGMQVCGEAPNPYTCGNQKPVCTGRMCQPGECGWIPDGCNSAILCPDCPFPKVCGGGGVPNVCH